MWLYKNGRIKTSLKIARDQSIRDHLVLPLTVAGRDPYPSSFANNSFCSSGVFFTLKFCPLACEQKAQRGKKTKG